MPMTYDDNAVTLMLKNAKLNSEGHIGQKRERLARYLENKYQDYMAAWEVRTGRPWNDMTKEEAEDLCKRWPKLMGNIGLLSILARGK